MPDVVVFVLGGAFTALCILVGISVGADQAQRKGKGQPGESTVAER